MRNLITPLAFLVVTACGGQQPPSAEACASFCDNSGTATEAAPAAAPAGAKSAGLTSFEEAQVGPVLEDLRAGVRPFDGESIGVCKGDRSCDSYIGAEGKDLAPGKYMVQAMLRVPKTGEKGTWKVEFATECTTTKKTSGGETSSTNSSSQSYEVYYAGEERPFRLAPLRTITSPNKGGARSCTYTIVAPHPDGDKIYKGSWSVPGA